MSSQDNSNSFETHPVLITGMSGAGLSSAARVLEDMGWYVSHNLPAELIIDLIELCQRDDSPVDRIAIVSDVRAREFHGDMTNVLGELREQSFQPTVMFMDARDDVLVKRFDSVRRTHPLQGKDTILHGIERERQSLAGVKEDADIVVDTSDMSVHDLRRAIENSFATLVNNRQHVTVQSFGFKHGSPIDADIVVDVRFLPNPYWVPELRPYRGVDKPVAEYVLGQKGAQEFLEYFEKMFSTMIDGYRREGKNFITIAVGCTGGHHRSVAMTEELGRRLASHEGLDVSVIHRDISRG